MTSKFIFLCQTLAYSKFLLYLCNVKGNERRPIMQTTAQTNPTGQTRPACSMDYALADIAAGRINHYNSLEELINKFK